MTAIDLIDNDKVLRIAMGAVSVVPCIRMGCEKPAEQFDLYCFEHHKTPEEIAALVAKSSERTHQWTHPYGPRTTELL